METLTGSSSKCVFDKYGGIRLFSASGDPRMTRVKNSFLKIQRIFHPGRLRFSYGERKPMEPVSSVSSNSQADLSSLESKSQEIDDASRTVRVRFQLQKECSFGEQFLIVGDDPIFGLWNPLNAVPLNWSDGHIWTVDLDIPIGKSIRFKFILKEANGNFLWQPGPDRSFQTWETKRTVTVSEDWVNARLQTILEEEEEDEESALFGKEEPMDKSKDILVGEMGDEPASLTSSDVIGIEGKALAENISIPTQNPLANARNKILQSETVSDSSEIIANTAHKDRLVPDDVFEYPGKPLKTDKANAEDDGGDMINYEGHPVLVPGLPPLSAETAAEAIIPGEGEEKNDVLFEFHDVKDKNLPELDENHDTREPNDGTPEADTVETFNKEEQIDQEIQEDSDPSTEEFNKQEEIDQEIQEDCDSSTEEKPNSKPYDNNVMQSDIQWGRKTLQEFLSNFGLL